MKFTTLFFDLDGTIYSNNTGLWEAIQARMVRYMDKRIGLPVETIPTLRREYYETYGTTLRGLQHHYQVDADEYLAYVHDLPLARYLQPEPGLRSMLLSLPQKRLIFTNADAAHAQRVLTVMDLDGCFEAIIDVRAIGFSCKPEEEAYRRALSLAGDPTPARCVFMDDSLQNIAVAHTLGLTTVLVGLNGEPHPGIDYSVPDLVALSQAIPALWDTA